MTDTDSNPEPRLEGRRVLFAGESWTSHTIHVKGFDSFTTSEYARGGDALIAAIEGAGAEVTYLPNETAAADFPSDMDALNAYDAVVLSDIGSNTLLLHPETFKNSQPRPDRCALLADWVRAGGGLAMVGGYLSFSGIDGKARYERTALAGALPVEMTGGDDRVEAPQGVRPAVEMPDHPVVAGLETPWPRFLGYNRLRPKAGADVVARVGDDVFLAAAEIGDGRSVAFASDCGPHWGPPEFVAWRHYDRLWSGLVAWLCAEGG